MRVSGPRGRVNFLLRRVKSAEQDIIEDRVVKQKRLLRDQADLLAQGFLCDRAQISAVDLYRSEVGSYKPQDERENRALTGSARPDQGVTFSPVRSGGLSP